MAYNDESVLSKLSALNDTQEGIVTAAQWIMFHRRWAKRTSDLWLQKLKESTPHRKLNLIYLANEVVQQSKARHKQDFLVSFAPIIAEAAEVAYKGSPPDIQGKIRRVVQVWRQRAIFETDVQKEIEQRLDDVDKGKSNSMAVPGRKLGGGLFGGTLGSGALGGGGAGIPPEFAPLVNTHKALGSKTSACTIAVGSAKTEFQKQFDADHLPAAPVYAARLSSLLKTLDSAHTAVKDAIEAREAHIRNLEKLLEQSKAALERDKGQLDDIIEKRQKTESTKKDVELMILEEIEKSNNGDADAENGHQHSTTPDDDLKSPEVEALTPPAQIQYEPPLPVTASEIHHQHSTVQAPLQPPGFHQGASELLASLSAPLNSSNGHKGEQEDVNMFEGLDPEVADMLRNDAQMGGQGPTKRPRFEQPEDDDEYHP